MRRARVGVDRQSEGLDQNAVSAGLISSRRSAAGDVCGLAKTVRAGRGPLRAGARWVIDARVSLGVDFPVRHTVGN